MSTIPRQVKPEREVLNIRLDRDVSEGLTHYTPFIASPRDYVIGHALRLVFSKDKEFSASRAAHGQTVPAGGGDLLQALNTGHHGSLSTIHANSGLQGVARFTACVLQSGVDLPYRAMRDLIADAVQLLVHLDRRDGTRVVTALSRVCRYDTDEDTTTWRRCVS